jgi:hypothetical protein
LTQRLPESLNRLGHLGLAVALAVAPDKSRGPACKSKPLSVADVKRLKEEHAQSVGPLQQADLQSLALNGRCRTW